MPHVSGGGQIRPSFVVKPAPPRLHAPCQNCHSVRARTWGQRDSRATQGGRTNSGKQRVPGTWRRTRVRAATPVNKTGRQTNGAFRPSQGVPYLAFIPYRLASLLNCALMRAGGVWVTAEVFDYSRHKSVRSCWCPFQAKRQIG